MAGFETVRAGRFSRSGARAGTRRWVLPAVALPLLLGVTGCDWHDDSCNCPGIDKEAPAAPRDLYSVTGDRQVTLVWLANTESDLANYVLWRADRYEGPYRRIADVAACADCYWMEYLHADLPNGQTLFYAVSAVDESDNESELSSEEVWDTPRPEGHANIDNADQPDGYGAAGFDLQGSDVVAADSPQADFYYVFSEPGGGFLIAGSEYYGGAETTRIQDLGWTDGFDEISYAPDNVGWSPTGTAEPIAGHTYVILTRDHHYAKIRLTGVDPDHVGFDWAFQGAEPWNRQLQAPEGS